MKRKLLHGIIFAVPMPTVGGFISGRVMLDVAGNIKRRMFASDSPLAGLVAGTVLAEMYSKPLTRPEEYTPSPVLIPGAFVLPKEIGKRWPIIGDIPVDPRTVEFPETVIGRYKEGVVYECGEMRIPTPLSEKDDDEINARAGFGFADTIAMKCEIALGLVPRQNSNKGLWLEWSDLRFSKHRARVYEHLPFSMEMSYYEKQKILGHNLERLYEL
jgi:hypothetical protein